MFTSSEQNLVSTLTSSINSAPLTTEMTRSQSSTSAGLVDPLQSSNLISGSSAVQNSPALSGNVLLSSATNLGALNGRVSQSGSVNSTNDLEDLYRFTVSATGKLDITLTGTGSGDADLYLIQDSNGNGRIDNGEVLKYSAIDGNQESLSLSNLAPGTYYALVDHYSGGTTNYTLTLTSDTAGNSLSDARNLGALSSTQTLRDFVGNDDPHDFYNFRLNTTSNVSLSLTNLSADADLYLVQDVNNNGIVDKDEILASSYASGTTSESISARLAAGNYFVWVNQYTSDTNYTLSAIATSAEPGNTLNTAANIGVLTGQRTMNDTVSTSDESDYYSFQLNTTSNLQIDLSMMSGDLDLYLIRDVNGNGLVDAGDVLAQSIQFNSSAERIELNNLAAGNYFVEVDRFSGNGFSTNSYTLMLSADTAGSDYSTARDLGTLVSDRTYTLTDFVGTNDPLDYYRFRISNTSNLSINLTGLTADADVFLVRDVNGNGIYDASDVLASSDNSGSSLESIQASGLAAGTYFIRVNQYSGDTNYTLQLFVESLVGSLVSTAEIAIDPFAANLN